MVALAEAIALLGYAISIAVVALTTGIQGPQEVSSPTGVTVEVATFALFGAGMAAIAWGRWRGHGWSTVPFVVTQLLALTVGIPMATGVPDGRLTGLAICAGVLIGLGALILGGRDAAMDLRDQATDPVADRH